MCLVIAVLIVKVLKHPSVYYLYLIWLSLIKKIGIRDLDVRLKNNKKKCSGNKFTRFY